MTVVKAHCAIIIKPIFRNVRKKHDGLFGILELDTQMLQQRKLEVMRGEQQCTRWMHFCAKEERVKRINLLIKGAIEFAHREVKVSHLCGNDIFFLILLDVSKIPDGPTAGSK